MLLRRAKCVRQERLPWSGAALSGNLPPCKGQAQHWMCWTIRRGRSLPHAVAPTPSYIKEVRLGRRPNRTSLPKLQEKRYASRCLSGGMHTVYRLTR
jgi:hypothetical protein